MITKFSEYIVESRMSIEDLEMLNPEELGRLLHIEIEKSSPDFQFIQDILDVGCPIDAMLNGSFTSLHFAVSMGNLELLKFLLSKGADIYARDANDWTVLHYATEGEYVDILKYLITKGAQVNAMTKWDETAWDIANDKIKDLCPELNPNK